MIEGLPEGATTKPLTQAAAAPQQVEGLPEGATTRPIAGLPAGATVRPIAAAGAPATPQPVKSRAAGGLGDPTKDEGYLSGLWQSTFGPLYNQAHDEQDEMKRADGFKSKAEVAIRQMATKTPQVLLVKMLAGVVHSAYEEGRKAVSKVGEAGDEGIESLKALAHGDLDAAGAHATASGGAMSEAAGHGMAAQVPIVGPAAANAAEKIGGGKPKEGLGEATGVLGTVLGPEAVSQTVGRAAKGLAGANEAEQAARAELAANTETKAAAADAAQTKATAAAQSAEQATAATKAAREGAPAKIAEMATNTADATSYQAGGGGVKAETFEQAADAAEEASRPLYAKINAVTNGKYAEFRGELQKAWKARDMEAVNAAEKKLDDLFSMDFGKGTITPAEEEAARTAWRSSKTLRQIHGAVESAFEGPAKELADRTGVTRVFKGGETFQRRIKTLVQKVGQEEVERVIGKDGLDNLVKLADATKNPIEAQKMARATSEVARQLEREADKAAKAEAARAGKAVTPADHVRAAVKLFGRKTAVGVAGALFGEATGIGREAGSLSAMGADTVLRFAWNQAATNPRVGKLLTDAVKMGADARVYAPLIAGTIIQSINSAQANSQEKEKEKKKSSAAAPSE